MTSAATPNNAVPLKAEQQRNFLIVVKRMLDSHGEIRSEDRCRFEYIDRTVQQEEDRTEETFKAKAALLQGRTNKMVNPTVPVASPHVMSSVAYQASVYLTGYPMFGVVAKADQMDAAMQMETIIANNSEMGGWHRQFLLFFMDCARYNFAPIEVTWDREVTASIATSAEVANKAEVTQTIWQGNKVKRIDPYNVFYDSRVAPTENHTKGEFAGYVERVPTTYLKTIIAKLGDGVIKSNVRPALESALRTQVVDASGEGYYQPSISLDIDNSVTDGTTNWTNFFNLDDGSEGAIKYTGMYDLTTLYVRVIPSSLGFKVPKPNTPAIYKLLIVNNSHIIYCEHQTNAHNMLPILIGQPNEDGLGRQTKTDVEEVRPFQHLASAYMASIVASRRRAISDRVLYDPSRVRSADINSANPAAKIPVRPSVYGQKVSEAVYHFPYNEDQASNSIQQIQMLLGMANQQTGHNQASQGQFVKGNKTLSEFQEVMQNANSRDHLAAIMIEHQVMAPLKRILKYNILQYQGQEDLFNQDANRIVEIDPGQLRAAVLEFKVADGLNPKDKLLSVEALNVALQVLGSAPEISGGYNITKLFSYLMKSQGAKIQDFEKPPEQVEYERAMGAWQQAAVLAAEKGTEFNSPQPTPEQFGWNPNEQRAQQQS